MSLSPRRPLVFTRPRRVLSTIVSCSRSTHSSPNKNILQCQKQALDSAELIKKRYSGTSIEDLNLSKLVGTLILSQDVLSMHPYRLMQASLQKHLPEIRNQNAAVADWLHLGHHQIFFRPKLYPNNMLPDGTDTRFIPGPGSIWQYRLWAGGSTAYNLEQPYNLAENQRAHQLEYIQDVRVVGEDKPEKVFVTVRRIIANLNHATRSLPRVEIIKQLSQTSKPPIEEIYTLCFLREPPGDPVDRKTIPPPKDALCSHHMTPDSNLLFHFSALTYNAHKIHFSAAFAKEEYGMKHIVVHGPFTQLLLTEFLRYAVTTHGKEQPRKSPFVKSIQYTNLKPLYADEPMTLCCKPLKSNPDQDPWQAESWRVWIQTGEGESAAMAVKAVIEVGLASTSSSTTSDGSRQIFKKDDELNRRQGSNSRPKSTLQGVRARQKGPIIRVGNRVVEPDHEDASSKQSQPKS